MDPTDHGVTHVDLLAQCTRLEQAGMSGDLTAVHAALGSLRNVFLRHLRAEEGTFDQLSPTAAAIVAAGQQRLLDRIDDLLATSVDGTECVCFPESLNLTRQIVRQARHETTLLIDFPGSRTLLE